MRQPTFFDDVQTGQPVDAARVVLYALGEFQARGKVLAGRELPLDRLRGALRRAADKFGVDELADEQAVAALDAHGAEVQRVPTFVAKHPFRVTVRAPLAERAREFYQQINAPNE